MTNPYRVRNSARNLGTWPSREEILALGAELDERYDVDHGDVELVRAAIARWGCSMPQPVAVSERLPGQEDCTAEGRCWLRYTNVCNVTQWSLILRSAILDGPYTHWLPANAIPTPEAP